MTMKLLKTMVSSFDLGVRVGANLFVEISFPEDAKITNLEFPDEDWWAGEYDGRKGLFPANYVQLDS